MIYIKFLIYIGVFISLSFDVYATVQQSIVSKQDSIFITVNFPQADENDTLVLRAGNYFIGSEIIGQSMSYHTTHSINGKFYFSMPVSDDFGYFDISAPRKTTKRNISDDMMPLVYPQLWKSNDSIDIYIHNTEAIVGVNSICIYNGRGAAKYMANEHIKNAKIFLKADFDNLLQKMDISQFPANIERILNNPLSHISSEAKKIIMLDMWYQARWQYLMSKLNSPDELQSDTLIASLYEQLKSEPILHADRSMLLKSREYLNFVFRRMVFLSRYSPTNESLFKTIVSNLNGRERDLILYYYFQRNEKNENIESELSLAKSIITDSTLLALLDKFDYRNPGQQWKDYKLISIKGDTVSLSEFDDKVVVLDFWFTACGGCLQYYKNVLSIVKERFSTNENIVFLSISIDSKFDTWQESVNSGLYTSATSVNLYTGGKHAQHPMLKDNGIRPFPFVILLNRGRILADYNSKALYSVEGLQNQINTLLN